MTLFETKIYKEMIDSLTPEGKSLTHFSWHALLVFFSARLEKEYGYVFFSWNKSNLLYSKLYFQNIVEELLEKIYCCNNGISLLFIRNLQLWFVKFSDAGARFLQNFAKKHLKFYHSPLVHQKRKLETIKINKCFS